METKQVKFKDSNNEIHYGILVIDKEPFVICGCCGGILYTFEDCEVIQHLEWINIENAICGE